MRGVAGGLANRVVVRVRAVGPMMVAPVMPKILDWVGEDKGTEKIRGQSPFYPLRCPGNDRRHLKYGYRIPQAFGPRTSNRIKKQQ